MTVDLERLSILVVEDSPFMNNVLSDVVRAVGIGRVMTATDGADAIGLLESVAVDPLKAGISVIDAIIADVFMPQVDGYMLMRWIRSSTKSPDRFVPTVMISGAADADVVAECRDLGATEFLAKPFSGKSVADKLMHLIFHPRKFILAPGYFGPDRRRTDMFQDLERRSTTKKEIQVVMSDQTTRHLRKDAKVIHFEFRNRLADKVGGYDLKGVPEIDPAIIEEAQQKIADMAGDYSDWVANSVRGLSASLAKLNAGEGDSKALLERLNSIALEMRGQDGIFDYPLVTRIGKSLYEATKDTEIEVTDNHLEFFKAHVDSIGAVINSKMKGDGGGVGRELLKSLEIAKRKFTGETEEMVG